MWGLDSIKEGLKDGLKATKKAAKEFAPAVMASELNAFEKARLELRRTRNSIKKKQRDLKTDIITDNPWRALVGRKNIIDQMLDDPADWAESKEGHALLNVAYSIELDAVEALTKGTRVAEKGAGIAEEAAEAFVQEVHSKKVALTAIARRMLDNPDENTSKAASFMADVNYFVEEHGPDFMKAVKTPPPKADANRLTRAVKESGLGDLLMKKAEEAKAAPSKVMENVKKKSEEFKSEAQEVLGMEPSVFDKMFSAFDSAAIADVVSEKVDQVKKAAKELTREKTFEEKMLEMDQDFQDAKDKAQLDAHIAQSGMGFVEEMVFRAAVMIPDEALDFIDKKINGDPEQMMKDSAANIRQYSHEGMLEAMLKEESGRPAILTEKPERSFFGGQPDFEISPREIKDLKNEAIQAILDDPEVMKVIKEATSHPNLQNRERVDKGAMTEGFTDPESTMMEQSLGATIGMISDAAAPALRAKIAEIASNKYNLVDAGELKAMQGSLNKALAAATKDVVKAGYEANNIGLKGSFDRAMNKADLSNVMRNASIASTAYTTTTEKQHGLGKSERLFAGPKDNKNAMTESEGAWDSFTDELAGDKSSRVMESSNAALDKLSDEEITARGLIRIKGYTNKSGVKIKTHYRKIKK